MSSLEHTISAKNDLNTYCDLLIYSIIGCTSTSVIFVRSMLPINVLSLLHTYTYMFSDPFL